MTPNHQNRISTSSRDGLEDDNVSGNDKTAVNTPHAHTPRCSHSDGSPASEKDKSFSAKERNEQFTTLESGLRGGVQLRGTISHRSQRNMGVLERKETIDLGDGSGPKEVILIDWTPDDPGVSHHSSDLGMSS